MNNGPGINETRKQKREKTKENAKLKKKQRQEEAKQKKAEKKQNSLQGSQQDSNSTLLKCNIGFENEPVNLVNYLFTLARDPNLEGSIQAANYAIEQYKEKLIENFDSVMVEVNSFIKDSIDYDKIKEINDEIHNEFLKNPNLELNKEKWLSSESLIFEGLGRINLCDLFLRNLIPELSKERNVENYQKLLMKHILQNLPATCYLIERFIRNELVSDHYLTYTVLRKKCTLILEIGTKARVNLLFDLDKKIKLKLDKNDILSDARSLLLCYQFSIMYLSYFCEDYSELLNQAFLFSEQLLERAAQISKPVLKNIKSFRNEFERFANEQKEDREKTKSSRIKLFNIINIFYINTWYSSTLSKELDKNFMDNVDQLILLLSKVEKNSDEIKFRNPIISSEIVRLLSVYNTMPIGDERYQAGIKVSQLLKKVIPYVSFSVLSNEKCVVLTTVAIFKRIENDIQAQQVELIILRQKDKNHEQNTLSSEQAQAIETQEINLIRDFSSIKINDPSETVEEKLKETQEKFMRKAKEIEHEYTLLAQTSFKSYKTEISSFEAELTKKEKDLIDANFSEIRRFQTTLKISFEEFKKRELAKFKERELQINQHHLQQVNACKEKYDKEKTAIENECNAYDKDLREKNNKELELLKYEHDLCQKNFTDQIETRKKQIELEVEKFRLEVTQTKEALLKQNKEALEQKEKEFQQSIEIEIEFLESQKQIEINLINEEHRQELLKLDQKLREEQPSILEKAKKHIEQNFDNNLEKLLNTQQEKILKLKEEYRLNIVQEKNALVKKNKDQIELKKQQFQKEIKDLEQLLKNKNQDQIDLINETHSKELQKLQKEQSTRLEEIKKHKQQNHDDYRIQLLNTHHEEISEFERIIEQTRKPYEAIIGLTPCAKISYFPGEARLILHLLEQHHIEHYIVGGYVRDAISATHLLDGDDIDIRVNCDVKDLPQEILVGVDSTSLTDTIKVLRVNLLCRPWKNLKEELSNTDITANALICRNGAVYDLLGVYDHLSLSYLILMKPPSLCFKENPAIILRLIRFLIKLDKKLLLPDYKAIHEFAYLIFNLPCGIYLNNLQKLFANSAAPEYYRRVKDSDLLQVVIPTLPDNYQDYYDFEILERFWIQKMREFALYPRHYDGHNVLALFLLLPLLLKERIFIDMEHSLRLGYVENYVRHDFTRKFVGFSEADQNMIHCSIPPLIVGNNEVPGLYQQYYHFRYSEFKNTQWVSQDNYSNVLTPYESYTPAFQVAYQSRNFQGQKDSASVSQNTTTQSVIIQKRNTF